MSRWSEKIASFEEALSLISGFWLLLEGFGVIGVLASTINEKGLLGLYMVVGLIFSEIWRRIVIGLGYVLLSIENKLPGNSSGKAIPLSEEAKKSIEALQQHN